jgi:hypothetical protein
MARISKRSKVWFWRIGITAATCYIDGKTPTTSRASHTTAERLHIV